MDNGKRITIKDVAKAAEVSVATVSRILGGSVDFSMETRKHVWDTIHSLHYEPNRQARMLRDGKNVIQKRIRTNLIMYVSYIDRREPMGYPVTAESMQMFSWIAQHHGLLASFYRYTEQEGFCCPPLLDNLFDGAILGVPHKDVIHTLCKKIPIVAMNVSSTCRDPNVVMVNPSIGNGLLALWERVKALGHERIAVVGAQPSENIYAGNYCPLMVRMLTEYGFAVQPEYVFRLKICPEDHEQKMAEAARALIPAIKTGKVTLIAAADMCYAETLYHILRQEGIRFPEDVSLISLNSVRGLGTPLESEITSIGHDWRPMMTTAIEVLEKLITGEHSGCSEYLINTVYNSGITLGKAVTGK